MIYPIDQILNKLRSSGQKPNLTFWGSLLILIAVLILLFGFVNRRMNSLKQNLQEVNSQVQEIKTAMDQDQSIDQTIALLEENVRRLDSKFPTKEEEALRTISDLARKFQLEIVSINSQNKVECVDKNSQKIELNGKTCETIKVRLAIKGTYKDLANYLDALRELLPSYMIVDHLGIARDASGLTKLNINLDLNLYFLS